MKRVFGILIGVSIICTLTIAAEVGWIGDEFKLRSGGITFDDATTQTTAGGGGGSGTVTNIAVASSNYTANLKIDAGSNITITHTGQVVNIAGAAAGGGGAAPPATNQFMVVACNLNSEWIQANGYSMLTYPDAIHDSSSGSWDYSTNTAGYTAPVAGIYRVSAGHQPSSAGNGDIHRILLSIGGGSPATQNYYRTWNRSPSGANPMFISADVVLTKDKKLEVWQRNDDPVQRTSVGSPSTNSPSYKWLNIYLIREGL